MLIREFRGPCNKININHGNLGENLKKKINMRNPAKLDI